MKVARPGSTLTATATVWVSSCQAGSPMMTMTLTGEPVSGATVSSVRNWSWPAARPAAATAASLSPARSAASALRTSFRCRSCSWASARAAAKSCSSSGLGLPASQSEPTGLSFLALPFGLSPFFAMLASEVVARQFGVPRGGRPQPREPPGPQLVESRHVQAAPAPGHLLDREVARDRVAVLLHAVGHLLGHVVADLVQVRVVRVVVLDLDAPE